MKILSYQIIFCVCLFSGKVAFSQKIIDRSSSIKPNWISETPFGDSFSYHKGQASNTKSLEEARKQAFANVVASIAAEQQVDVRVQSTTTTSQTNNNKTYNVNGSFFEVVEISTGKSILNGLKFEEEYWQKLQLPNGSIQYESWILMRLPKGSNSRYTQKSYGFAPVWRSALMPGWGQFYKKQNTKGIALLAATGVILVGAIVTENQRSSNYTNALNTRDINERRAFISTADNWKNSRNAIIAVGGAIYLYNLIDAIATKGAKIYAYKPPRRIGLQTYCAVNHTGFQLIYHLK
jgi:hypothetical protein